jgi:cellulose synthase (UDP-forming)
LRIEAHIGAALIAGIVLFVIEYTAIYLDIGEQSVLGWASLAALLFLFVQSDAKLQPLRLVIIAIGAFLALRYILWRTTETLIYTGPADFVAMSALYLAEVYAISIHFLGMFINAWPVRHQPLPMPENPAALPSVDVFIPTYNEPDEIIRITAVAATQIDYPREKLRVWILDDGGTVQKRAHAENGQAAWERHYRLRRMARELGIGYITRSHNTHAKAGNVNHALHHTDGELILVLDCDHVPTKDILQNTVGHFVADAKLFLVQTPHFFINPTPIEKNLAGMANVPSENDMFYRTIHAGLDSWNSSYFCGSAALLRRSCLEEVGGICGTTITEDAETAFALHSRGYNSIYIDKPMVCGLSPESYDDYVIQRSRWAQGMVQLFLLNNPIKTKGLSLPQRLAYMNSCFFWFFGLARFIYFVAPALFLIFGLNLYNASWLQIQAFALPYVLSTFVLMHFFYAESRNMMFSEIYESVQALFLIPALIGVLLNPHKPTFKVTPKGQTLEQETLSPLSAPFLVVIAINCVALLLAIYQWLVVPVMRDVIVVTGVWCIYNLYLALVSLGAFWERKQVRAFHRINISGSVRVHFPRMNATLDGEVRDISLTGIGLSLRLPFPLAPQERVLLESTDSWGQEYRFEAKIHRAAQRGDQHVCGAEFVTELNSYEEIVSYVYGDSERWQRVWDANTQTGGTARLLWHFVKLGIKGFGDSARVLWYGARSATAWVATRARAQLAPCAEPWLRDLGAAARGLRDGAQVLAARVGQRFPAAALPAPAAFRRACLLLFLLAIAPLASAETLSIPLAKLSPYAAIDLRCINGGHSISIPIPERWQVRRAVLGLRYTASNNLIADMSQLVIRLNEQTIAQTRLNPLAPNVELALDLPVALLKADYNQLAFQVAQHASRHKCEQPCAPDLWTNLNLAESTLTIEYNLRPLPLRLGAVANVLFDPKIYPEASVHLVTETQTPETATLAAIVASGIARRFDYRKVSFSVGAEPLPGRDNVIIGSLAFVNRWLARVGEPALPASKGGLVRIVHGRGTDGRPDPTHATLLVAGASPAAQQLAAETLASLSLPYPGGDTLETFAFKLPEIAMYGGRQILSSDKVFDFKTLNFPTFSWQGFNSPPNEFSFRLPADFMIKQNQYAKLTLNFTYGAGLRNDSVLNVHVNGKPLRAIHLDQVTGSYLENYEIKIPTYVFKPGANTIAFVPALNAPLENCALTQSNGMFLTVFENSTLYFPPMPHYVEMPKLDLFALNGFPVTRWPDGHETMIHVPKGKPRALEAAYNLIGVITQKNGFPLFGIKVVFDEPRDWEGELIVIGNTTDLPADVIKGVPLKAVRDGAVPYPVVRSWDTELTMAVSEQVSELGSGTGALMQFESPYRLGRSVLLLTGNDDDDVAAMGLAMLDPGVQGSATGDLMLVDLARAPDYKVTALRVGKRYTTGNRGDITPVEAFLFANPLVLYALLVCSILALALIAFFGLRNYRRARVRNPELAASDR